MGFELLLADRYCGNAELSALLPMRYDSFTGGGGGGGDSCREGERGGNSLIGFVTTPITDTIIRIVVNLVSTGTYLL